MRKIIALVLSLAINGCALGYTDSKITVGLAIGDAKVTNTESCDQIEGGKISKNASGLFDKLFGWLTIAF